MAIPPRDQIFSKDERNKLYLAIASSNLDPAECEYKSLANGRAACIFHASSDSGFLVERSRHPEGGLRANRTLADVYLDLTDIYQDFGGLVSSVKEWANAVAGWVDVPDLWGTARIGKAVIPGEFSPDSNNAPFTPDERVAISAQLNEIKETVKNTCKLTAEQSKQIDEKFEEAEKASRRMGRKDWGLLFGGAVFSLILADVITPGVAGHILIMIEHGVGHLFSGGTPPVRGVLSGSQD
jgi:hypothetical protein